MSQGKGKAAACVSAVALSLVWAAPALAQDEQQPANQTEQPAGDAQIDPTSEAGQAEDAAQEAQPETDILSIRTFSLLLDARVIGADGATSFVDGGLGKTRFDGDLGGDFRIRAVPVEASLIWQPRFTEGLSGNVSAAWQLDQDNAVDLLEAFLTYLPARDGGTGFALKAGLYWPEISLEHATGGAWSTVHTITPSAINSWVGEEVKVLGLEGTLMQALGEHDFWLTAGIFGFNDTSGTLLSFRGWALHDIKATAFGYFPLPPLNDFIEDLQESRTRSLIEIDDTPGWYARFEWRPPWPFSINAFYYDNLGDPRTFTPEGQWGWRTRFLNVGATADLGPNTRLLAQGMIGSTLMGFNTQGRIWVHTEFSSAYALVTHQMGDLAISGRVEYFDTDETGSRMSPLESEDGWAVTLAGRYTINENLTAFIEALHVQSDRGVRTTNFGIPAQENQTVLQASLRLRL